MEDGLHVAVGYSMEECEEIAVASLDSGECKGSIKATVCYITRVGLLLYLPRQTLVLAWKRLVRPSLLEESLLQPSKNQEKAKAKTKDPTRY